jgi:hypothetical protein
MPIAVQSNPVKVINRDQWMAILEFSNAHNADVASYDENGACKGYNGHTTLVSFGDTLISL